MFNLETKIAEWRKKMIAAGITETDRLAELEQHLREDFATLQEDESVAFDAAVARVGHPPTLAREFEAAAPHRLQRLDRLFPADLTWTAICTLVLAPISVAGVFG